jgi:hypothetical protein
MGSTRFLQSKRETGCELRRISPHLKSPSKALHAPVFGARAFTDIRLSDATA